jgi:hypothetical protein
VLLDYFHDKCVSGQIESRGCDVDALRRLYIVSPSASLASDLGYAVDL